MKLFDVTIWEKWRLVATAENIVANNAKDAVVRGLRSIGHRRSYSRKSPSTQAALDGLAKHLEFPESPAPAGVRAYAAEKPRGVQVI